MHSHCVPEVLLLEVAKLAVQFVEVLRELSLTGRGVTDVAGALRGGKRRYGVVCCEGVVQ